ncbi:hypothetical protein [Piscirickettsia litoralis]|uniref:Uncharacterized protein n=1 Tax=Piscirickettsia litoralis TaxID=1891921 RepID=A0ABX3A232_9GAMM|nr:hypothetical protein [Piscirickettsia litoralis]ODN42292.1 hypothetical protein BGC07_04275 [Piscirickettsia litoralis]
MNIFGDEKLACPALFSLESALAAFEFEESFLEFDIESYDLPTVDNIGSFIIELRQLLYNCHFAVLAEKMYTCYRQKACRLFNEACFGRE